MIKWLNSQFLLLLMNKKESLITSDRLFYKIQWHPIADTKKAFIMYLDYGILKTISYHDWLPIEKGGEIPWHRIYMMKYGDKILWDRDNRQYFPELLDEMTNHSNMQMLRYVNKSWTMSHDKHDILPQNIKIISFNCLMDIYDKHITNINLRMPTILHYLEQYNADIVCLQEITIPMKKILMDNNFIKNNYYVTGNEPKVYGQITLTKYMPVEQNLVALNANDMKKYITITCLNSMEEKIDFVNIHLTSVCQVDSTNKQKIQLDQLFSDLINEKAMIIGDYNNELPIDKEDFNDVWTLLKPNDDGFTFDYMNNSLCNRLTRAHVRMRLDRFLSRKVTSTDINIIFNESLNSVWPSDHFGVICDVDTINDYNADVCKQKIQTNSMIKSGNVLCIILELEWWQSINKFRKLWDDNVDSIAPHVTLIQKFVDENYWSSVKHLINVSDQTIEFNKVEIFTLTKSFAIVLCCSDEQSIVTVRSDVLNYLNIDSMSRPHITLGMCDTLNKALSMQKMVQGLSVTVNTNCITYSKKIGDQYQIYDIVGNLPNHDTMTIVKLLCSQIESNLNYDIVGSRAYDDINGDYDIVVSGQTNDNEFILKLTSLALLTPYVTYAMAIDSHMMTVNLILRNGKEVDIIYTQLVNGKIVNRKILESFESITIVKNLVKNNNELFNECLKYVKIWAKKRNIYGSKYGYFSGVHWLVLTVNLFHMETILHKKMFLRKFFKYYSSYDWSIPINITNKTIFKNTVSDEIVYISSLTKDNNMVRTITHNTFKRIKDELNRTQDYTDLNIIFNKIVKSYQICRITIADDMLFTRIKKQMKIIANIWKLTIKSKDIVLYTDWINKDNTLIYDIGLLNPGCNELFYNYFKPFSVNIEFVCS
jgi:exonuclease III/uncharacterized protein (UPF0248 family)